MPAVDPARLRKEIDSVLRAFDEPDELRHQVVDLLLYYSDRTRPSSYVSKKRRAPWSLEVPGPVMRSLRRALSDRARKHPENSRQAADTLWAAGYRETQLLAIELAALFNGERTLRWVETKMGEWLDGTVLNALADCGMARWRSTDPRAFLDWVSAWMAKEGERYQAFGLAALKAAVEDEDFEDLPSVILMMRGLAARVTGEARRQFAALTRSLARKSGPETAQFLLDELVWGGEATHWLIKQTLDQLQPRQRGVLGRALSDK